MNVDVPPTDALVLVAADRGGRRVYLLGRGAGLASGELRPWEPGADVERDAASAGQPAFFLVFPTATYSEGLGGGGAEIAPEDRAALRAFQRRVGAVVCAKVGAASGSGAAELGPRALIAVDPGTLRRAKEIFVECMTRPNRQDFMYLVTKTFGLNLAVRLAFAGKAVAAGQLPLGRAVISTSWYQLQDAVFTVFGQTYMKFLGRMTGLVRVGNAHLGDFFFVYVQLCGFEFLNRLVLGPLGENPLVYTWTGLGLIFANILQGMISGGPLIPAVNQARRAGVISHSTMMHFYQLTSLTMQFGLFATFGYQRFYALLTGATLLLSWTSYFVFSALFKDPPFHRPTERLRAQLMGLDSRIGTVQ